MAARDRRKRPERRSAGLMLDIRTAGWLARRFVHASVSEVRRTIRVRRSA